MRMMAPLSPTEAGVNVPAKRTMSKEHKAALAKGREEGAAVRAYLNALGQGKKRGRKVDAKTLKERLSSLNERISSETDGSRRLDLIQQRYDLEARLNSMSEQQDLGKLESQFVKAARGYSERKGISYGAWREVGVPPAVLKKAGVARTRRTA